MQAWGWCIFSGRVASTPDRDTFEKYRDTPPICITMRLQKYALLLVGSSVYTTHLYYVALPIHIRVTGSGSIGALPTLDVNKVAERKFPKFFEFSFRMLH